MRSLNNGKNEADVQHPGETAVKLSIDALEISQGDLLAKDHLVECGNEVRIQEAPVEDTKTQAATNELKVVQVLRVDAGRRDDVEGVVVVRKVLKQTVEKVEHLMREQKEVPICHTLEFIPELSERATHVERPP